MRRMVDQLAEQKNKRKNNQEEYPDIVEIMMEHTRALPINEASSVFDKKTITTQKGINTEASVFHKTAVFPDYQSKKKP